ITSSLPEIIRNHTGFVDTLVTGIGKGFERFADDFPGNVLDAVLDWAVWVGLGVGSRLPPGTYPRSLEVGEITLFFLHLAGFNADGLRKAAQVGGEGEFDLEAAIKDVLGQNATLAQVLTGITAARDLFDAVWGADSTGDPNPFGPVGRPLLIEGLMADLKRQLIEGVIRAGVKAVLAYASGGVLKLVDLLRLVVAKAGQLLTALSDLLKKIGAGIKAAAGLNVERVRDVVNQGIAALINPALTFLVITFGLDPVVKAIGNVLRMIQEKIQKVIQSLVNKLRRR
ncbi:unnamed protein product, partial [Phaeothamnion confervicola]